MSAGLTISGAPKADADAERWGAVFAIEEPHAVTAPVVFASPHSGRRYPAAFLEGCCADLMDLRRIEDAYVDRLLTGVNAARAPLIHGLIGRACVDLNRAESEIDPTMFSDGRDGGAQSRTPRVAAGIGCIPRVAHNGAAIYARKLTRAEAEARLRVIYRPYHRALEALLRRAQAMFGEAWLIDMHSMPDDDRAGGTADVVIGDRFGASCSPAFVDAVDALFRRRGYRTARNSPYAGGYATVHHGRPAQGRNAIQIELHRRLYLDEREVEPSAGFPALRDAMTQIAAEIVALACADAGGPGAAKKKAASDADAAKVLGRKRP